MAPIRVGIIGLSSNALTSWASVAHLPYLVASNGKYEIRALCNSSVESAQAAINEYKLPSTTKAYGTPEDLTNDPNIDLVVCSVRVDKHYRTIKPSIEAGKDVFVEWPLGANYEEAAELATLAKEKGVRTMTGLQGRVSPIYLKVKALLQAQTIGKVLGSSLTASGMTKAHGSTTEGLKYLFERRVGGNLPTIGFSHLIDPIHKVLGPFANTHSAMSLLRPKVKILSPSGEVKETIEADTPDHIIYSGTLNNHDNAPISIIFRGGPPFKNTPGFIWSILGETGEIRVEAPGCFLNAWDAGARILVQHFETGQVQEVDWEDKQCPLKNPAKNIGSLYEAFASGKEGAYPTFEEAVGLHKEIDELWKSWDAGR